MKIPDTVRRYYENKVRCPHCKEMNLVSTEIKLPLNAENMNPYKDTFNRTACKECGWSGIIDDLLGK